MALSKVDVESGGTGLVAAGTSGNVLTSDGTDWTSAAAAGGGAWTLISTVVLSNQSSVNFTGLSSTYDMYAIICSAVGMNTPAGQQIWFRVSTDNGSSFISAGQYRYHVSNQHDGDSGYYRMNATSDSKLRVSRSTADAGATMQMQLFFSGHATANQYMPVHWNGSFNGGTNGTEWWHGAGGWNQNTIVNAVQIVGDGGTFDTGRITLYGIAHA